MALSSEKIDTIKSICFRIYKNHLELSDNYMSLIQLSKKIDMFAEDTKIGKDIKNEMKSSLDKTEDLIDRTNQLCKRMEGFVAYQEHLLIEN